MRYIVTILMAVILPVTIASPAQAAYGGTHYKCTDWLWADDLDHRILKKTCVQWQSDWGRNITRGRSVVSFYHADKPGYKRYVHMNYSGIIWQSGSWVCNKLKRANSDKDRAYYVPPNVEYRIYGSWITLKDSCSNVITPGGRMLAEGQTYIGSTKTEKYNATPWFIFNN